MFLLTALCSSKALIAPHEQRAFLDWMRETGNIFVGDEYYFRLGVFLSRQRYIQELNRKNTFRAGMNHLCHLTFTEYLAMMNLKRDHFETAITEKVLKNGEIPAKVDWRDKGVVNPIQDQGRCGSCWAFATIQAIESQWAMHHNELFKLSEQSLVDCVDACFGCSGGNPAWAMKWIIQKMNGGVNSWDDYPWTMQETPGSCKFNAEKIYTKITDQKRLDVTEEELAAFVAEKGVLAINIDACHESFLVYKSGIYTEPQCHSEALCHSVGLIGYGTDDGTDYWLVRNSMSKDWGEEGYIRMIRNFNNQCGIATEPYFPVVSA